MFLDLPEKSQVNTKIKVVFIGDIRGRDVWIDVVQENKDADKFVFFGNYFDPFTGRPLDTEAVTFNFIDLVNFKDEYPDKVVLLLGQNEYKYLSEDQPNGSFGAGIKAHLLYWSDRFSVAYQFDAVLCSSRGISWAWLDRVAPGWNPENVANEVNELFKSDPSKFAYYGKSEGDFQYCELGLVFESPFHIWTQSLQYGDRYGDGRITNRFIQVYSGDQVIVHEGRKYEDNHSQQFQDRYYNVNALQSYPGGYLVLEKGKFIPKTIQGEEYHRLFRPRYYSGINLM